MLAELGTILASSGAGSIIGGVFGFLNRKEDRKDRESEREYNLKMVAAKTESDVVSSEARSFEESQKTTSRFGDAIKSAFRPIITAILLYQMYRILTSMEAITGGLESLPIEITLELYKDVVLNIISLTSTSVSWWFASRPSGVRK
jgi:hypothetical protein